MILVTFESTVSLACLVMLILGYGHCFDLVQSSSGGDLFASFS